MALAPLVVAAVGSCGRNTGSAEDAVPVVTEVVLVVGSTGVAAKAVVAVAEVDGVAAAEPPKPLGMTSGGAMVGAS